MHHILRRWNVFSNISKALEWNLYNDSLNPHSHRNAYKKYTNTARKKYTSNWRFCSDTCLGIAISKEIPCNRYVCNVDLHTHNFIFLYFQLFWNIAQYSVYIYDLIREITGFFLAMKYMLYFVQSSTTLPFCDIYYTFGHLVCDVCFTSSDPMYFGDIYSFLWHLLYLCDIYHKSEKSATPIKYPLHLFIVILTSRQ